MTTTPEQQFRELLQLIRLPDKERMREREALVQIWTGLVTTAHDLAAITLPALRFPEKRLANEAVPTVCALAQVHGVKDYLKFLGGEVTDPAKIRAVWATTAAADPREALTVVAQTHASLQQRGITNLWEPIPPEAYSRIWLFATVESETDLEWAILWAKQTQIPGWLRPKALSHADWADLLDEPDPKVRERAIRALGRLKAAGLSK